MATSEERRLLAEALEATDRGDHARAQALAAIDQASSVTLVAEEAIELIALVKTQFSVLVRYLKAELPFVLRNQFDKDGTPIRIPDEG